MTDPAAAIAISWAASTEMCPTVSIGLLADHPPLIPAVGEMRWREWGRPPEPESLDWWVEVTFITVTLM